MVHVLVIMGSSRSQGDTRQVVDHVINGESVEFVDLLEKNITTYDYQNRNRDDDFLALAERMVAADVVIFATPVYWYSMSAVLKTFFDRFSDLITIRKDLGRALAGTTCFAIAVGAEKSLPEGFEVPFRATCDYLSMAYRGCFYYCTRTEDTVGIEKRETAMRHFAKNLAAAKTKQQKQ